MSGGVVNIFGLGVGVSLVVFFFGILWLILHIFLFFKVWGMTNDIRKIKRMFEEQLNLEHPYIDEEESEENKSS